jgi:hypothetical protein
VSPPQGLVPDRTRSLAHELTTVTSSRATAGEEEPFCGVVDFTLQE